METASVPAAVSKHELISARDSHFCIYQSSSRHEVVLEQRKTFMA